MKRDEKGGGGRILNVALKGPAMRNAINERHHEHRSYAYAYDKSRHEQDLAKEKELPYAFWVLTG